jgi:hypothetical protein
METVDAVSMLAYDFTISRVSAEDPDAVCDADARHQYILRFYGMDEGRSGVKDDLEVVVGMLVGSLRDPVPKVQRGVTGGAMGLDGSVDSSDENNEESSSDDDYAVSSDEKSGSDHGVDGCESGGDDGSLSEDSTARSVEATPPRIDSDEEETKKAKLPAGVAWWLGYGKNTTQPTGDEKQTGVPSGEWAKVDDEMVSEDNAEASSNSGSLSSEVSEKELENVLQRMECAEEGRATELGRVTELKCYGNEKTGSPNEDLVVDRPSLDYFKRLDALEGANLRKSNFLSLYR